MDLRLSRTSSKKSSKPRPILRLSTIKNEEKTNKKM